jgi:hypothetical protein
MRKLWVIVAAAAVAAGMMASPAGAASKHTITGDLTIHDSGGWFRNQVQCAGSGGFSDLEPGAQVTVKNAKGKTIAVGQVTVGHAGAGSAIGNFYTRCVMPLKIKGVPDSSFYAIEVAHRGALTYPKKKLQRAHWRVHLTIG